MRAPADFLASRGWRPFAFQKEAWGRYAAGESGLIHAPTGFGKTYAAYLGAVGEALGRPRPAAAPGLTVLWLTPLRALANDTLQALAAPPEFFGLNWRVESRHSDTSSGTRKKQRERLPTVLVTTPESLTVLLSYPPAPGVWEGLRLAVVDEWHELLGTKRGVQAELALERLRTLAPGLRVWGLSATLGNLAEARAALLGPGREGALVRGDHTRRIEVETLIPQPIETFPWSGHLGLRQLPAVAEKIAAARSTLVFTNTRAQTELWFDNLLTHRPEWLGQLALHHGSLDRSLRAKVEAELDAGCLRAVVCTSSLDLGVDFAPVDQVIQIGSPKGIAKLTQRAGRSGHHPGGVSRIVGVPTNALELVEYAAAREALARGEIEGRRPLRESLDVLVQHLLTVGCGGGFAEAELRAEVRRTHAFAELPDRDWEWALRFAAEGGESLGAYAEFRRLELVDGRWRAVSEAVARQHRLKIGTIASEAEVLVRLTGGGGVLGGVEESFASRLRPGDVFSFGGRRLELVRLQGLTATVRPAKKGGGVAVWAGSRSPLSSELAHAVLRELARHAAGAADAPELRALAPLLAIQAAWSALPGPGRTLAEFFELREGPLLVVHAFAGRTAHEGLGTLAAHRWAAGRAGGVRVTVNDYAFALHASRGWSLDSGGLRGLLAEDGLAADLEACMNTSELARRQFREVARVAGLINRGYPGRDRKTPRQVQASAGLLFDMFSRYEPHNLLLAQTKREILDRQLEFTRLRAALARMAAEPLDWRAPARLTPLAFPLWAEMIGAEVSAESRADRLARLAAQLAQAAG